MMWVEEVFISIEVRKSGGLHHKSKRQGDRTFLLLARDVFTDENEDNGIIYHLLMLEPKDNFFERVCAVCLSIRTDQSWVLRSLGLARTGVLLG